MCVSGVRPRRARTLPNHGSSFDSLNDCYCHDRGRGRRCAAGYVEGRNTLDGIRGAVNFDPAGLTADDPIALFGYSGAALDWIADRFAGTSCTRA
ncbi:lipase family protein [Nocardia sp. NPDC127526]|uniref:lipase family protein n=1 Tax=Nocardia sp. NPDC127526 TaxID=3345393 RepID=UPI003625C874